jgi:hypothetical protein
MNTSGVTSGIVTAIVLVALRLVFGAFDRATRNRAQFTGPEEFRDREFHQYPWIAATYLGLILLAASWTIYALTIRPRSWEVFGIVGALFALLSLSGIVDCWCSRVVVAGSRVSYRRIVRETSFDLSDVRNVWTSNGYIVVDLGRIPRIVIPTLFADSGVLLAILTYYRPKPK